MNITLPYPPSVNTYWRSRWTGKYIRHHISHEGERYRRAVILAMSDWDMLVGPLAVRVDVFPPDRRARDLDNVCKSLLDAMEHAGVYEDDSQIADLHLVRRDPAPPGRVEVTVTQAAREWQPELFQRERA